MLCLNLVPNIFSWLRIIIVLSLTYVLILLPSFRKNLNFRHSFIFFQYPIHFRGEFFHIFYLTVSTSTLLPTILGLLIFFLDKILYSWLFSLSRGFRGSKLRNNLSKLIQIDVRLIEDVLFYENQQLFIDFKG